MQLNATINQAILCFIVPPPEERPHSSWRAIIYTKELPEKNFYKNRTLPSKIVPDREIMKNELCDPDHIPAFVIQITDKDAFVYIEGDVCEIIGTEISIADGHSDPYLKGRAKTLPKNKPSPIIMPGTNSSNPNSPIPKLVIPTGSGQTLPQMMGPVDLEDTYIVDLTFKTTPLTDPEIIDRVKQLAWNNGISIV